MTKTNQPDSVWAAFMAEAHEREIERRRKYAARRALAEAEARRQEKKDAVLPREVNGPRGPEPTRYGDWEKKGVASDF